jgi:hypothetical protein
LFVGFRVGSARRGGHQLGLGNQQTGAAAVYGGRARKIKTRDRKERKKEIIAVAGRNKGKRVKVKVKSPSRGSEPWDEDDEGC